MYLIIEELLSSTYNCFEFLPVLKVAWRLISIKTVRAFLIPLLFRVFYDVFQFWVAVLSSLEYKGYLLGQVFQVLFGPDSW